MPCPNFRDWAPNSLSVFGDFLQDNSVLVYAVSKRLDLLLVAALMCGHSGHSSSTESIKDDIPRSGVVEQVPHDCFMRNFGVIAVSVVNGIILSLADICCKRFQVVVSVSFNLVT